MSRTKLLIFAADVLFPRRCPFCGEVVGFGTCEECAPLMSEAERREPELVLDAELSSLDAAASPYWYVPPVKNAILSMKFSGERETARSLAEAMCARCAETIALQNAEAVIAVPSSPDELRSRGYSVPGWLAEYVSSQTGLPVLKDVLIKVRETERQVNLTGEERRKNLRGAFRAKDVPVRRVLLVDDVFTTGSTLNECAKALRKAGAESCTALTAAVARR